MNNLLQKLLGSTLGVLMDHPWVNGRKTGIAGAVLLTTSLLRYFKVIDDTVTATLIGAGLTMLGVGAGHKAAKGKADIDSSTVL